ncbi:MAG: RnfABCDGE type electron transport complex subunit B [Defluviitaleaceae bacterium]|nr:RnfABCDGE type electron transport complex subunit B [Defluviitaleaceae bacterium]
MNFTELLLPAILLGTLGLTIGAALGFASRFFAVEENKLATQLREVLPGINCGACNFPGCDGFALAVALGNTKTTGCPVGGKTLAEDIAEIMGTEDSEAPRVAAYIKCAGSDALTKSNYNYAGVTNCNAAALMAATGPKACRYGCLGKGSCAAACPFDAIEITGGVARVNMAKCVACTLCVPICPKNLIEIVSDAAKVRVACNSKDRGPATRTCCTAGCIGCGLCLRNCPKDAIILVDNLAKVDYDKCTLCGICIEKCPTKAIHGPSGGTAEQSTIAS